MANRGAVVWLTGLSGAGKSTLSAEVGRQLAAADPSRRIEVLDGDEIRLYLSQGLTFTREDRDTNVHRIAYVARLLAKHNILVLAAVISPYAATRAAIAKLSHDAGHDFVEVFVNAPLATVAERDVKGLYKKALAGEIGNFTGVSDPYEAPENPAIEVRTDRESLAESAAKIVDALRARNLV
jgi:adenylyl-sulfate kinase